MESCGATLPPLQKAVRRIQMNDRDLSTDGPQWQLRNTHCLFTINFTAGTDYSSIPTKNIRLHRQTILPDKVSAYSDISTCLDKTF